MKTTTIQVWGQTKELLDSLKTELKADDFNQVISELIKCYRETHGWSAIALAEQLKHLKEIELSSKD